MSIIGPRKSLFLGSKSLQSLNVGNSITAVSLLAALLLIGCSNDQLRVPPTAESAGISGAVHGGQQPITGASIQLYAAGTSGDGSAATPLITASATTDGSGSFELTGLYQCPAPASEVYLVATGGNPGLVNGETNAQISLMVTLGPCGNLTAATFVEINEVTTVAAAYAVTPYMQSYSAIGSNPGDAQMMADAFTMAAELANTGTGSTPGVSVPAGQVVPSQKLNTLASIVAACINSSGGKAGDSSSCGQLFSLASAASSSAPTDTVGALLDIAQNPTSNVVPIFDLDPPTQPFQPSLSSPPADWTLGITSPIPSPAFSPAPGTYAASPSVTLSDSNPSAAIYYTTDGSQPTSSSIPYTGAIALSGTTTIRAVAIAGGISSLLAAGTYALAAPTIALTPGIVTLTSSQTQPFTATVAGSSNAAVTWSLSPTVGSISAAGLYTAPASITAAQTVAVTATSVADSTKTASAAVSLAPPVSIGLTPGSVTLTPSQTQAFTASVANSSNTVVTWSLSPAVGSISAAGLYSAPASITSTQAVTVTATSVANPTKSASSSVSLVPPVSVALTPTSVTLTPSQTQAFTANVAGTSNTAVTWSLSPAVGSISAGGLYTAPASISSAQTVTVTATSVANSTKSASASVSLAPPVSVALTPGTVTLTPSQTQMFTASVAGTSNTAVTWSLNPAVGSISAGGLYTAPAAMPPSATVTITATSVSDPTKAASAEVTIVPPQAAGYSLAWEDTFSTLSLCTTNVPGCNWYSFEMLPGSPAGIVTDPFGTYVNLEWTSGESYSPVIYTNISTSSSNGAYNRAWTYGYFEVSMAFNPTTGSSPAIWMLPTSMISAGNPSTASGGELDVFEWQSTSPTFFNGTVHVRANGVDIANNSTSNAWTVPGGTDFANYNRYGVLWTPTAISWYLNDVLMETVNTTVAPYNAVFGGSESYSLILSQQAGCNWSASCPGQVSPLNMNVQWVHVYASSAE